MVTSSNSPHFAAPLHPNSPDKETFCAPPHPSIASKAKRLVDVLGAVVGLAIAAPIGFFIAIAIKIEDRGPILYWQTRCGLYGKTFRMGKFRSMIVDADRKKHLVSNQAKGFIFKNDRDPRITRVGRFIRKTSLDELPQLWNVLQGEMSLVGTRPPTPDEACQYELHHWQRLRVKPGITGEWQVNGRSRVEDFEDIVKLDLAYQEKWSFWYDLYIIWKTIWVVLRVDGAY